MYIIAYDKNEERASKMEENVIYQPIIVSPLVFLLVKEDDVLVINNSNHPILNYNDKAAHLKFYCLNPFKLINVKDIVYDSKPFIDENKGIELINNELIFNINPLASSSRNLTQIKYTDGTSVVNQSNKIQVFFTNNTPSTLTSSYLGNNLEEDNEELINDYEEDVTEDNE